MKEFPSTCNQIGGDRISVTPHTEKEFQYNAASDNICQKHTRNKQREERTRNKEPSQITSIHNISI